MEYHKIETLYERDERTFKLKPELILKNPTYGLLKSWEFTEKIDGTNVRATWNHATGTVSIGGKTDNAQLHKDLVSHVVSAVSMFADLRAVFPDTDAVLYGEGYGAGIQKGGGDYSLTKKFILFDVLVDGKWWLSHDNVRDVASKLGLDVVPFIGEMTLEEATEMVRMGFQSPLAERKNTDRLAEGLVGRPKETLFDKKGARLIVKLKTKDFGGA